MSKKPRICPRCKKPKKLADWARYKDGQLKHICKACQTPQERRHSREYEPVTVSPKVLAQTLLQPVNGERWHKSTAQTLRTMRQISPSRDFVCELASCIHPMYQRALNRNTGRNRKSVTCDYGSGVSMRGVK